MSTPFFMISPRRTPRSVLFAGCIGDGNGVLWVGLRIPFLRAINLHDEGEIEKVVGKQTPPSNRSIKRGNRKAQLLLLPNRCYRTCRLLVCTSSMHFR